MSSDEFTLSRIGQIALTVNEVDRSINFYRDILGIKMLFRAGNLAFFDCAGIRLMLSPPEGEFEPRASSVIYFRVRDINEAYETLVARRVSFIDKPHLITKMPDHELWMAFFKDPDGNVLALMAEVRN